MIYSCKSVGKNKRKAKGNNCKWCKKRVFGILFPKYICRWKKFNNVFDKENKKKSSNCVVDYKNIRRILWKQI